MEALKVIQFAEQIECELLEEGQHIRVMNIKCLPAPLEEKIKEHKVEILRMLMRDQQAKEAGFIIGLSGTVYTLSLNKNTMVYIEQIRSNWESWQEAYQKGKNPVIKVRVICNGSPFEYVLLKTKSYIDHIK
ncbi:hypothetical protein COC52_24840 [Priestia megaterium]|uniref:hypothetical protein n=1 Tax=Priestia megaterium TaxID=1404 RepID=UPI000BFD72D3|nr:hypothetical protein [Priestia megaterium]PGR23024.1 hypothetical protein COC52_24840 [Priestia megaterium]